ETADDARAEAGGADHDAADDPEVVDHAVARNVVRRGDNELRGGRRRSFAIGLIRHGGRGSHDAGSSGRDEGYASLPGGRVRIGPMERHTRQREAVMNVRNLALSIALSISGASVLVLGAVACGGSVEQPQTTASVGTKAPLATPTHGMVKVMGDALGD